MKKDGEKMIVYCVNCGWKQRIPSPALVIMLPKECPLCASETEIKEG